MPTAARQAAGIVSDIVLVAYAVGWLLVVLALAMLVPAAVDAAAGERDWQAFLASAGITLFFGAMLVFARGRSANRGCARPSC